MVVINVLLIVLALDALYFNESVSEVTIAIWSIIFIINLAIIDSGIIQ